MACRAQTPPADSTRHHWTMEQCMAYAARHASSVAQARWDVASATATKAQALADFFPSVSAQIGGQFSWGRNIDPGTNTYNILKNAIEANARTIDIEASVKADESVEIRISNDGDPIPDDTAEHIFTPFFTTRECGFTGHAFGCICIFSVQIQ